MSHPLVSLDTLVTVVSVALIAPAQLYRSWWRRGGLYIPPVGFAILSLYGLTALEDPVQKLLAVIAGVECSIVSVYTAAYADAKYGGRTSGALYTLNNVFGLLIILFVVSDTVLEFSAYFALAGVVGFFVIAFDSLAGKNNESWAAAVKYLIVSMVPSDTAALVLAGLAISQGLGSASPTDLAIEASPALLAVMLAGFAAKAAVAPLHFWIADAHSVAPSPSSAILSGLMVKMGVYALYVVYEAARVPAELSLAVMALSALTAIYGGLAALAQDDMKRLLAYSTMSHTSTMSMMLALGESIGETPAIAVATYIVAHSAFKSTLFLDSGFVELAFGSRSLSRVRSISKVSTLESAAALLAVASLIGAPPTAGFMYKLFSFIYIAGNIDYSQALAAIIVFAVKSAIGAGYGVKYLVSHLGGKESSTRGGPLPQDIEKYTLTLSTLNILSSLLVALTAP